MYDAEVQLCDDSGMVSEEPVKPGSPGAAFDPLLTYVGLANNLRAHTGHPPVDPFHCTGSMHAAGMHFRCTSPAHRVERVGTADGIGVVIEDGEVV